MAEPKPFASLTSGLLARKGGARPAMRPQSIDKIGSGGWEDLGWNDMGDLPGETEANGHRTPSSITGLTPAPTPQNGQLPESKAIPAVVEQQRAIEESFALPSPDAAEEPEEDVFAEEPAFEEPAFEAEESYDEGEAAILGAYELESSEEVAEPVEEAPVADEAQRVGRPAAEVVELSVHRTELAHAGSKAAFTLRLDEERHLKLRLACAVQNRSAQRIVCGALDAYLNSLPELDSLAQQVPARRDKRL